MEPQQPQAAWTIHWSVARAHGRPRWEWLLYLLGLLVLAHTRLLRKCKPALELEIPSHYIVFANSELDKTKRFSRRPFLVASVMTAFSKSGLDAIRHLSVLSTKSVFPRFFGFCLMAQWLEMVLLRVIPQHGDFLALWVYVQVTGENSRNRKPQGFFHLLLRWQNENHGQTETLFVALGTITNISNT